VGTGTHVREAQHVAHLAENNEVAHEITKLHEFDAIVGITLLDGDHLNFDVGINHSRTNAREFARGAAGCDKPVVIDV
jgi:hypothetical protein